MACGTPVVALDSSAVKELVNENNGDVLHAPRIQDYIDAIKKCERMKSKADAIRRSVEKYSVQNMVKGILEIYSA